MLRFLMSSAHLGHTTVTAIALPVIAASTFAVHTHLVQCFPIRSEREVDGGEESETEN